MWGSHLLTHWSRTQSCVALSSGEAELNGMLKAASEGLQLKYLLGEIGEEVMLLEQAVRLLLKRATLASGVLPTTPGPIFPDLVPVPK